MAADETTLDVELAEALGATAPTSIQVLTLYIPNKDRDGGAIADQERWVREAAALLARIGGGVTVLRPVGAVGLTLRPTWSCGKTLSSCTRT